MTLHPGFAIKGGTQDAVDYRLGLAGSIVRSRTGVPRYGVFQPGVAGAGRTDMKIDIGAFVAYVGRGSAYGGVMVANDGTLASPTFDAAPSSNSRIDVVWVRQNDVVDGAGANNLPEIGIAKGTAAASPTQPAVPTGALALLAVLLPALAASTSASGVTITQAAPFTAPTGSVVEVKDKNERDAFAWCVGQPVFSRATLNLGVWNGYGFVGVGSSSDRKFRKYYDSPTYEGGDQELAAFTIPGQPYQQRVLLDVSGTVAPQSAGNAGVAFETTNGTLVVNANERVYTSIGSQPYGFSRAGHVDLPANVGATIRFRSKQSVPTSHSVVCKAEVLAQGEYV